MTSPPQRVSRPPVPESLLVPLPDTAGEMLRTPEPAQIPPVLASALYAARPLGWTFGLGVACAAFERLRLEQQAGDDFRARESQVAGLAESRRRAEAARASAEQRAERVERELREERQSRRDRDASANQKVAAAERKAADIQHEVANARTAVDGADARIEREAARARKVDDE